MRVLNRHFLIGLVALLVSGPVFSEKMTRDDAVEVMAQCQMQRQAKIAPLRQKAIEDCVTNKGRDREYCERFNRSFGDPTPRAGAEWSPGCFGNSPSVKKLLLPRSTSR